MAVSRQNSLSRWRMVTYLNYTWNIDCLVTIDYSSGILLHCITHNLKDKSIHLMSLNSWSIRWLELPLDLMLPIFTAWNAVITLFSMWLRSTLLVTGCLFRLLLLVRVSPRTCWIVVIAWSVELLLRRLKAWPWISIALLHQHMRMTMWHVRLCLLLSITWLHLLWPVWNTCGAILVLHHALRVSDWHISVTGIRLEIFFFSLDFLVLLVTSLTLALCVLLGQRWASLTRPTPKCSLLACQLFFLKLWLILFTKALAIVYDGASYAITLPIRPLRKWCLLVLTQRI